MKLGIEESDKIKIVSEGGDEVVVQVIDSYEVEIGTIAIDLHQYFTIV